MNKTTDYLSQTCTSNFRKVFGLISNNLPPADFRCQMLAGV